MKNALFVAGLDERYYFDQFIEACETRGISVFLFDPSRYPSRATVSVSLDNAGKLIGFIDTLVCKGSTTTDARLSISDIHVAWHLRESAEPRHEEPMLETRFAINESRAALHSIFSTLDCPWINKADTIHFLSSNKLYQQKIAQRCGLRVPHTVMGNDAEYVSSFSQAEGGLLLKSIGYMRLDEEGIFHLYSERFSHEEIVANLEAIRRCPHFCQEYVRKKFEHRVMVIGNRVLSCRIDSQASPATSIDWRHYDFENVSHVEVELPRAVEEKLLRFMHGVGLRYGAIDLIETPEGEFVFLEVNPTGQWGWIADLAGLPIPAAVADMIAEV